MLSQIICSVFPGDKQKKRGKKNLDAKSLTPKQENCISGMQSKIDGQKVHSYIFQHSHKHPKPKVVTPEAMGSSLLAAPSPRRAAGAGFSGQHHAPICASYRIALGKSPQAGRGAPSAPPARAPPPPGWPPAAVVPLTCRRSVAGCHIFQPRGLAEETLVGLSR